MWEWLQVLMPLLRRLRFCYSRALTGHGISLQGLIPRYNVPVRYQSALIKLFTSADNIGSAQRSPLAVRALARTVNALVATQHSQR